MEFKSNVNADCCTPTGKYELCGCVSGVPYIQLTVVGGGTVQTAWLNTETGDTFTTKPAGFVTGTCSEAAASDVLKFSGSAPTGSTPFASPKDGYTTVVTDDGTATGDVTAIYLYDAETATWVKVPSTPLGGTEGQVLTAHTDGSRTWETPAADVTTTLTDTVTGHKIGTYTNELAAAVTLNETITSVDNATFNATTGMLSFDYYDETGTKNTLQTSVPVGDKYKTASTTCNNIVSTGTLTFTVGTGLAYTALQDIIAYADGGNHMNGHVISYDSATGVLVMEVDQKTGAGNYCNWVFNLDAVQAAALVETTTTLTSTVTGHKIGTYTNEVNAVVDINETVTDITGTLTAGTLIGTYHKEDGTTVNVYAPSALDVLGTTQPTPTATGNTTNLNSVFKDANGDTWIVDGNGDAIKAGSAAAAPTGVNVYFNDVDPSTATIFDDVNPPVTDDPTLKNSSNNTYYGTDGSVWTWNGSAYVTKTYSFPTWRFTTVNATAAQTSYTLPSTPVGSSVLASNRGVVHVTRNGVDISRAWQWVGPVGTYVPANNFGAVMDANDLLQFHWEAY